MDLNLSDYRRLALAALWIGLIITAGVFFAFIPNIEFVTLLCFMTGVIFGPWRGMVIAGTAEALFSAMNPIGSGLAFPILFLFQLLAMAITALVGGFFHRRPTPEQGARVHLCFGILGGVLTLFYDFLTALSLPLTAGIEDGTLWGTALAGIPFFLVHIAANALLFALFMPGMIRFTRYHLSLHGYEVQGKRA